MLRDIFAEKRGKKVHRIEDDSERDTAVAPDLLSTSSSSENSQQKNQFISHSRSKEDRGDMSNEVLAKTTKKRGHPQDLSKYTRTDLQVLLEKNEQLLKKTHFMQNLPDKGEKLKLKNEEIKKRLSELSYQPRIKSCLTTTLTSDSMHIIDKQAESNSTSLQSLLERISQIKLDDDTLGNDMKKKFVPSKVKFISLEETEKLRKERLKLEQQHRLEVSRKSLQTSANRNVAQSSLNRNIRFSTSIVNAKYRDSHENGYRSDSSDEEDSEEFESDWSDEE